MRRAAKTCKYICHCRTRSRSEDTFAVRLKCGLLWNQVKCDPNFRKVLNIIRVCNAWATKGNGFVLRDVTWRGHRI